MPQADDMGLGYTSEQHVQGPC
jgi:hypothetical protein